MTQRVAEAELVSKAAYARHRGVPGQEIGRLARAGRLVLRHGLVDVAASDALLDAEIMPGPDQGQTLTAASLAAGEIPDDASGGECARQKLLWEARQRRLGALQMAGTLLLRDEVELAHERIYRALRDRMLAIPHQVADVVICMSADEAENLLRTSIEAGLVETASSLDAGVVQQWREKQEPDDEDESRALDAHES